MMIEEDYEFSCPYCGETVSVRIDAVAGECQAFVYDCEVCCRPIQIKFEVNENEVQNFVAESTD